MEITNINQLDLIHGLYTYADYLLWEFEERVELLRGRIFRMSGASVAHQRISRKLLTSSDGKENTVLQPDLCVVCDPEKLKDGKRCNGAPDWVVEIVSPSNAEKELRKKMEIYQEAQVSEYWVIRPEEKELDIYLLREGRYVPQLPLFAGDIVAPEKFPQLQIDLTTIF